MSNNISDPPRGGGIRRGRGGARGRPVKKAGPSPARHIPWPEIFRHHISLVEGHLKMIDMVRKHTVEGSGNSRTINSLVERARAMLKDARATEREFVPPKEAWRNVPIGSASDTMYPGYSPKDHQYGKAAEEFGKAWSEARKRGIEFDAGPNGPEYQFGQSKGAKKRRLNNDESGGTGESSSTQTKPEQATMENAPQETAPTRSAGSDPLFFFDSNPTPVKGKGHGSSKLFTVDPIPTSGSALPSNNLKKPHTTEEKSETPENTPTTPEPAIEFENIDRVVDARLKLKQEAKRNKKDHKRKRETDSAPVTVNVEADDPAAAEKPPKKKPKPRKNNSEEVVETEVPDEPVDVEMEDSPSETHEQKSDGSGELKRKKKSKKNGDANGASTRKKSKKIKA